MGILKRLQTDRNLNPWLDVADKWLAQLRSGPIRFRDYLGDLEKKKVEAYNAALEKNSQTDDRYRLILDMPPCPCVGHPSAPIWFMLKNPGCSAWDWYDIYSVSKGKKMINSDEKRCVGRIRKFLEIRQEDALHRRQELVVRQLRFDFDNGSRFYPLEDVFRTYDGGSRVACGAYDWYDSNLFPRNGFLTQCLNRGNLESAVGTECIKAIARRKLSFCARNIFVLDYHPYRTQECYDSGIDCLKTSYWDELVKYALRERKLMIFWGSKILERVRTEYKSQYEKAVNNGRIIVLHSPAAKCSIKSANRPLVDNGLVRKFVRSH